MKKIVLATLVLSGSVFAFGPYSHWHGGGGNFYNHHRNNINNFNFHRHNLHQRDFYHHRKGFHWRRWSSNQKYYYYNLGPKRFHRAEHNWHRRFNQNFFHYGHHHKFNHFNRVDLEPPFNYYNHNYKKDFYFAFPKKHHHRWFKHNKKRRGHFNLKRFPKTENLTQELKDSLAYMLNEERLAYDIYMNLYNYFKKNYNMNIRQLYKIAQRSERKHIATVKDLVKRYNLKANNFTNVTEDVENNNSMTSENMQSGVYDIPKIQELYDTLYAMGKESREDALKVGCMLEVTDINDLNKYIQEAEESNAKDIKAAFKFLRKGSYNHYWAFDRGLKRMGISDGCCSLGDEYCHPEYPKKHKPHRYKMY